MNVFGLSAVTSVVAITADWESISLYVLETVSTSISIDVRQANRVVYDITSKPPSTIEWE